MRGPSSRWFRRQRGRPRKRMLDPNRRSRHQPPPCSSLATRPRSATWSKTSSRATAPSCVANDSPAKRSPKGIASSFGPSVEFRFGFTDEAEESRLRQLYESSVLDALTGAFNRKHFAERLTGEMAYARRHATPRCRSCMFDLDHFKRVNDTHGASGGRSRAPHRGGAGEARRFAPKTCSRVTAGKSSPSLREASTWTRRSCSPSGVPTVDASARIEFNRTPVPVTVSLGVASLACCPRGRRRRRAGGQGRRAALRREARRPKPLGRRWPKNIDQLRGAPPNGWPPPLVRGTQPGPGERAFRLAQCTRGRRCRAGSTSPPPSTTSTTCRTSVRAYTTVAADVLARYHRLRGARLVLPHRHRRARAQDRARRRGARHLAAAFSDEMSAPFRETWPKLDCHYDHFVRTTDPDHEKGVGRALDERSKPRETFTSARTRVGTASAARRTTPRKSSSRAGICPHAQDSRRAHSRADATSSSSPPTLTGCSTSTRRHPVFVQPTSRMNEVKSFVRGGLEDLSVSRTTF